MDSGTVRNLEDIARLEDRIEALETQVKELIGFVREMNDRQKKSDRTVIPIIMSQRKDLADGAIGKTFRNLGEQR